MREKGQGADAPRTPRFFLTDKKKVGEHGGVLSPVTFS